MLSKPGPYSRAQGRELTRRLREARRFYWRDRGLEVDFVARRGTTLVAVEVKSTTRRDALPGMHAFAAAFRPRRKLLVGGDGIALEDFLARPVLDWFR